jgi:hypothetical protein
MTAMATVTAPITESRENHETAIGAPTSRAARTLKMLAWLCARALARPLLLRG